MKRRALIGTFGGGVLASGGAAWAQQSAKVPKVGYLFSFAPAEGSHLWEACRQGLRDLGYAEGRNIALEPRWADGHHQRLPALVHELLREKVDVIVAAATPANLAAKAHAGLLPVVMVAVADPVRIGLAASFAKPGSNFTGLSLLTPELSGKRLQLIVECLRSPPRAVAVLRNPENGSHDIFFEETQAAAQKLNIVIQRFDVRGPHEIEEAFGNAAAAGAHALVVFDDPVLWSHRKRIVLEAGKARMPIIYGYSEFVREGGLISLGPHRPDLYRRTAVYVDRILKGAVPQDLPIERPTRFEMVVNLRTAQALGLAISQSIVAAADEVIE